MTRVVIVGGGQNGSRHLQSLAASKEKLEIFVVDPSRSALDTCKLRFDSVKGETQSLLFLEEDYLSLPKSVDLAIIATGSRHRKAGLENFFDKSSACFLILEKFLFPNKSDYADVSQLIQRKGVHAWVNCNLRTMPIFQWIKRLLKLDSKLVLRINGSRWGLGCNSVHFMDLFSFFVDRHPDCYEILNIDLDEKVIASKRVGYIEFNGRIEIGCNEDRLVLDSEPNGTKPLVISIENDVNKWTLVKGLDQVLVSQIGSKSILKRAVTLPLQSEMTSKILDQLAITGTCDLPSWDIAFSYHLAFIEWVLRDFATKGHSFEDLMVT
ncbi:MAG: Gfo/Idh/MocA family oxidoreductase [Deltaproteobacteria bacterium]|nr:Gfo/Idh/MocA family oxidoreductase [Deltaproteobacteria bacterium]